MRSVAVVFPASMCAEIPMLRYRSMGVVRAKMFPRRLRAELNGVEATPNYHALGIFPLAHGRAAILGGFHQFSGQSMRHRFLAAIRRRLDDPTHCERLAAIGGHFDGHLIGGAADAA